MVGESCDFLWAFGSRKSEETKASAAVGSSLSKPRGVHRRIHEACLILYHKIQEGGDSEHRAHSRGFIPKPEAVLSLGHIEASLQTTSIRAEVLSSSRNLRLGLTRVQQRPLWEPDYSRSNSFKSSNSFIGRTRRPYFSPFLRERMGSVIGKIDVEVPKHTVLEKGENYEIREYPECLAAEVIYDPTTMKQGRDGGFMMLAGYIGAVGKPNNVKVSDQGKEEATGEKIAMTAPVITQEIKGEPEKIGMTAPVITQETQTGEGQQKTLVTMQFLLPAKYKMDSVPKPTDERVKVKEVPARKYGVLTFSGVADDTLTQNMLGKLRSALQEKGYKITGDHILARYNPPWTVGFLRTNEVMLPVE